MREKQMRIEHPELGIVNLCANARAKRVVARYRDGEFYITHPQFTSAKEVAKSIETMKLNLIKLKENALPKTIFDESTDFYTATFALTLSKNTLNNVYTSLKDGILNISYPQSIDINSERMQNYIRNSIENACRAEANRMLPSRVESLAALHSFRVNKVKINKSRSRWGSCSSDKNINLSYFCMMLPQHLIDFVILHELCHTKEMNHGTKFWQLLDAVSNDRAKELTQELKKIKLKW